MHNETLSAIRIIHANKGLHCIQFPTGKWGFRGDVPAYLALVTAEGNTPTDEQMRIASAHGPRLAKLKTRTWNTEEEALSAISEAKEK